MFFCEGNCSEGALCGGHVDWLSIGITTEQGAISQDHLGGVAEPGDPSDFQLGVSNTSSGSLVQYKVFVLSLTTQVMPLILGSATPYSYIYTSGTLNRYCSSTLVVYLYSS
jgi:hypothetical protein